MNFAVKIFLVLIFVSNLIFFSECESASYQDIVKLESGWKFCIDPESSFLSRNPRILDPGFDDSRWEDVEVPHSVNLDRGYENYSGICWYRKKLSIPLNRENGFVYLEFRGSYLITDVWFNGNYLGRHNGGYTGFKFEITSYIAADSINTIVVRCDSTKRADQAPGAMFIWFPYTGLIREVNLAIYPSIFPESIFIDTNYTAGKGEISLKTIWKVKPELVEKAFKTHRKVNFEGRNVTKFKESLTPDSTSYLSKNVIKLKDAHPWSPDDANLYQLETLYTVGDIRYERSENFGIREITTSGRKILLNGEEIKLLGVALFEDSKDFGPLFDISKRADELAYAKSLGVNMLRLGHYPNHPDMLSLCDEYGFIVYEEIPVWQYNLPDSELDEYIEIWAKPQLEEMVSRDYNHPSLCFIGVANEIRDDIKYLEIMLPYAKEKASTRLITYASDSSGEDREAFKYVDVISKNFHYGWFHSESPYDLKNAISDLSSIKVEKPIFISEVGAMSIPDFNTSYSSDIRFSEEYHNKVITVSLNNLLSNIDILSGLCVWTLFDFRGQGVIATSGLYDFNLKPRLYSSQVQRLFKSRPYLLILDTKTYYNPGDVLDLKIRINCSRKEAVSLSNLTYTIIDSNSEWVSNRINIEEIDWQRNFGNYDFSQKIPKDTNGLNILQMKIVDQELREVASNFYYFDVGDIYLPSVLKLRVLDSSLENVRNADVVIDDRVTLKTDYWGWCTLLYYAKTARIRVSKTGFRTFEKTLEMQIGKTIYQTVSLSED